MYWFSHKKISRATAGCREIRAIAGNSSHSISTISREVTRNGGSSCYWASAADQAAWARAHRTKRCRLLEHRRLAWLVATKWKEGICKKVNKLVYLSAGIDRTHSPITLFKIKDFAWPLFSGSNFRRLGNSGKSNTLPRESNLKLVSVL